MATFEPMIERIMVEAPAGASARFLHLVQGADGGAVPTAATLIETADGFVGLAVNETAVLFATDWDQSFAQLSYTAPAGTTQHIITGLPPSAGYAVTVEETAEGVIFTLMPNGDIPSDTAGVLVYPARPQTSSYLPLVAIGS